MKTRKMFQEKDLKERLNQISKTYKWITCPFIRLNYKLGTFDFRQPATILNEIQKEFEEEFSKDSFNINEKDVSRFIETFADISFHEKVKKSIIQASHYAKKIAKKDQRYSLLIRLMKEVDTQVSLLSIIAFSNFHPVSHFRRMCEPADLIIQANKTKGEIRARSVIRSIRETIEMLYNPFLEILWKLSYLRKGQWPPRPPGSLARQTAKRLQSYPGIIEINANWLRNAASHAQWIYKPSNDSLILWDRKVSQKRIKVNKLLSTVTDMYRISGPTLLHVYELYMTRDLLVNTGIIDAFFDSLLISPGKKGIKKGNVEKHIIEEIKAVLSPLEEFIKTHRPTRND